MTHAFISIPLCRFSFNASTLTMNKWQGRTAYYIDFFLMGKKRSTTTLTKDLLFPMQWESAAWNAIKCSLYSMSEFTLARKFYAIIKAIDTNDR